jgi:hypothetical protein
VGSERRKKTELAMIHEAEGLKSQDYVPEAEERAMTRKVTPLTPPYAHMSLPCRRDSHMLMKFAHAQDVLLYKWEENRD